MKMTNHATSAQAPTPNGKPLPGHILPFLSFWAPVACLTIALLSGCAASKPQQPKRVYNMRDSQQRIAAQHKRAVPPDNLDYALVELQQGWLFFLSGDYMDADARIGNALKVMDRIKEAGGRETTSVVADERAKVFKGEPYERATAFCVRGLCRFNMGDYSGALAAFRSSLASDAETRNSNRKYLEDFTVSQFMAALCYARLGEMDNAQAMLELARTNAPCNNPFLQTASLNNNFTAVIGVGSGPFKIAARTYATGLCPEKKVELAFDENPPTQAVEATDLLFQAKCQGRGAADNARVARKVGKAILSGVLSGLTGVNVNIQDYDDIRSWHELPMKIYIFSGDIPAGNHTITLRAYGDKGEVLDRYTQVWHDVPVPSAPGPVVCLKDVRNMQNHFCIEHEKVAQASETAVAPTASAK